MKEIVGLNPFASLQGQVKRILFEHDEPTYGIFLTPSSEGELKGVGFVILRNEGSCLFILRCPFRMTDPAQDDIISYRI
jgi:hypothetical protein